MVSIAIVWSEFNKEITEPMLKAAMARAKRLGLDVAAVSNVPGAFDMPLAIKTLLERKDIDGIATIGAVIKGQTKHDELISYQVARAIIELSLEYGKPIGMGIIGPGASWNKAKSRAVQYANQSVEAVLRMHSELRRLKAAR